MDRTAVDQSLHRLVASKSLRRTARGFSDISRDNRFTGKPTLPNPRDVIDALARKGKVRVVVYGLTAANDLGLTDAVPACIGVLTDGHLRPITLGNLTLDVALFNELEAGGPSLLLKGGTSLSKGYGLIERFSEDIGITVFREDSEELPTFEELEALSGKKLNARLEAIKAAPVKSTFKGRCWSG